MQNAQRKNRVPYGSQNHKRCVQKFINIAPVDRSINHHSGGRPKSFDQGQHEKSYNEGMRNYAVMK